ncbi:Myb-like_DNA-binding domain-containing protein [Hexamita inflata]|uniref:Myb-like DNA-binding domain-containing protein n=1 Tax=Hexamita inflata TaxID=28002 RepID=A0AA86UCH4_9EUKA|nr:Myb-like DNA-binding domain-containing protein [Hexamita inflata]
MKQLWSEQEKQRLLELIEQNKTNSRVDWKIISQNLQNRTPTQCKLQYRHVLNKNTEKVNFEWTYEKEQELRMLVRLYGKKWTFLQKNYFEQLSSEKIRVKFHQLAHQIQQYNEIVRKAENKERLQPNEVKIVEIALERINKMKVKMENLEKNEQVVVKMDPLELKFVKEYAEKQNKVDQEQKKLIELLQQIQSNIQ